MGAKGLADFVRIVTTTVLVVVSAVFVVAILSRA